MLKLITAPPIEPLQPEDLEAHLHVDSTAEYDLLKGFIKAAREKVEAFTARILITQTWKLLIDQFPYQTNYSMSVMGPYEIATYACGRIEFPFAPFGTITSIKYYDNDGVQQTIAPADYTLAAGDDSAYVVPAYNKTWPTSRWIPNAIEITFTCGYGNEASQVPEIFKQAIKLIVGFWYENREAVGQMPDGASELLWPWRDPRTMVL